MISQEETLRLIALAQKGDGNAKNTLIQEHSPLVKSLIRRYRNKNIEYDDLYQLGCVGFTRAINKFDTKYNVQFSTYAVPIILGEVKRQLRDDGYIKVSRTTKMKARLMKKFIEDFINNNSRSPQIDEISKYFDIDAQETVFIMDSIKMPVSIYEQLDDSDNSQTLCDKLSTDDNDEQDKLDIMLLKDMINTLSEKERKIIILRYFKDRTQTEIANELGVSQVQVSRIECKAIERLKANLL